MIVELDRYDLSSPVVSKHFAGSSRHSLLVVQRCEGLAVHNVVLRDELASLYVMYPHRVPNPCGTDPDCRSDWSLIKVFDDLVLVWATFSVSS